MEHLIKSAVKTALQDSKATRSGQTEKDKDLEAVLGEHRTRIRVVGCGGGGNNTITRLMEVGISGVETLAVNTDAQDLLYAKANDKILIGRTITSGLGAGSDPKIGEDSALENKKDIEDALNRTDMVFVTCGLGGGTGTGSAPVVAEIAKKLGALTISIVTLPFTEEGTMRWENARSGLEKLGKNSDTVIVVQNDRLLEIVPDMPLDQAFKVADEILVNAVKGITELVTEKGLVNLDFADVRSVMRNGGTAMIGLGEGEGADHARHAVEMALQNPLLDVDINGARSALINITGGAEMSLKDAKTVMKTVAEKLDTAARVIWGARVDKNIKNTIRVMLIVTGLRSKGGNDSQLDKTVSKSVAQSSHERAHQMPQPVPAAKAETKETGQNAAEPVMASAGVFSRLFAEEARTDIEILRQSVSDLIEDPSNRESLRGIKNAALALNNSAQLFAFNQIADFAGAVEHVSSRALAEEIKVNNELVELYFEVPEIIDQMIAGKNKAYDDADALIDKLRRACNQLAPEVTGQISSEHGEAWKAASATVEHLPAGDSPEAGDELAAGRHDEVKISRVNDAVVYVKNLFAAKP